MKHLKITLFSFIALFISANALVSCSNETESTPNETSNKNVESFLKSFYNDNFQLGNSIDINPKNNSSYLNRTTEFENFVITEIFVGEDTRARGYIITDKTSEDLIYFFDVDRIDYKITSVDLEINQTKIFTDINDLDKYLSTDGFDFIKIVEDPDFELPGEGETISFRVRYSYGSCVNGVQGVYQATYFLGIRFTKVTATMEENSNGNLVHATVPCGTAYNPN